MTDSKISALPEATTGNSDQEFPINDGGTTRKIKLSTMANTINAAMGVDGAATNGALPANTYSNGANGVGATLTATANGALVVDGVTVTTGMSVLVKDETDPTHNGLYDVTQPGDSTHPYVLTRSASMNLASQFEGAVVVVGSSGIANANTIWICQPYGAVTIGTTSIQFQGFTAPKDISLTATNTTTARLIADRFGEMLNVRDFGAVGDGTTDDSAAFAAAINKANSLWSTSKIRLPIVVPSGNYRLMATTLPTFTFGGAIFGFGPRRTFITVDKTYPSAPVFSWSEAWTFTNFTSNTLTTSADVCGPELIGLTIVGDRSSTNTQHGVVLYDRNDHVIMRDVEVTYLNGRALWIGSKLNQTEAYTRESSFTNFKVEYCGTSTIAAVEISSFTESGSDATNELDFYRLSIFGSAQAGLVLSNPNDFSSTRNIRFFGCRVESSGGDGVSIGLATDQGQVAIIGFHDLEVISSSSVGLRITTGNTSLPPYEVSVIRGSFTNGNGKSVQIDVGMAIDLKLDAVDAGIVLGTNAGSDIHIDGPGAANWSWSNLSTSGVSAARPISAMPFRGMPKSRHHVGVSAFSGSTNNTSAVRLTEDGQAAGAGNVVNLTYSEALHTKIRVVALDKTNTANWMSWSLSGVLELTTGPGATTWTQTEAPVAGSGGTVTGASLAVSADTTNGGLNITFTPPTGNADTWNVAALLEYVLV